MSGGTSAKLPENHRVEGGTSLALSDFEPNVRIFGRSSRRYHKSASVLHVESIFFQIDLDRSPLFWKFRGLVDMSWFHKLGQLNQKVM